MANILDDIKLRNSVTVGDIDNGMVMRPWPGHPSSYMMIGTSSMGGSEYSLLTDGTNTFISGGVGGFVSVRGGGNDTSPALYVNNTYAYVDNGNFGIGTTSPSEKLEVNGNVLATQFIKSGGTSSQFLKADGSVDSNSYLTTIGGTITGTLEISGAGVENAFTISGSSPTMAFKDTTSSADDFYIHVNSNNFYILRDVNGVGDYGVWDAPHPLTLEADTGIGYLFANRIFDEGYHPNADKWTTARTITLSGDLNGSVSIDGSANVTLSAQVVNDSHTHDGRYYTESESDSRFTNINHFRSTGTGYYTSTTTSDLLTEALGDGAFNSYLTAHKTGWSYAGNGNLTDAGRLTELAGTSWLWWTDNSADATQGNVTALCIAPNTGGSANKVFIYNNQGSGYSPGWREVWTNASDGSGSGLDADLLDGIQGASLLRSDDPDSFTGDYLAFPTLHLSIANNNSTNGYNTYFRGSNTHFVLGLANGNTLYMNYGNSSGTMRTYGTMNHEGNTWMNTSRHIYSPIYYDDDNTGYYLNPASRSELTATNMSLNDATALTDGTFNVSKTIKGGIHFTNGAGTGTANGYQASITFQGSSASESQAGIYVHNNNSTGTYMALATTNNYSNGPQVALRIDNNGKIFADRNFIQSNTDMRAPIFYDSDNTGYYVNPAAGSKLSYLGLANDPNTSGSYRLNMGGSIDMNNNAVHYLSEIHFQDNVRFYDDGNDSNLNFKYGDADAGAIVFWNGGGTRKGLVYASSGGFGLLDNDGNWAVRTQTGTSPLELSCDNNVEFQVFSSYTLSPGSSRAPVFYDSNNTAYYINGDGTSYLNNLNVNNIDADNFKQLTDGVPRNNLGSPTVTEMALFDRQFGPKTTLANNYDNLSDLRFYKQDTSSSAWDEITTYSDDQKRRFLRTANSSVIIPYGVYKFRVEFKAPGYVYANAMYGYWSSQGHNTQIQVWKYNQNTSSWSQHTSATNTISSWPGHMYLPFSTIPWHETITTSTNHFSDIRFEFTPNWNASYSSNSIALYGMEVWGGYPAGKRDIHSYDQNGRFIAWGDVHVGNGDLHASKIYDYNDTNYHLDPNSLGYSVRIAGDIGMNNGYRLWFNSGDSNWQFGRNIYSASGESLTSNTVQLKVYGASDQGFQILDHNNVAKHEFSGDGNAYFDGSVTAPIFYDSGNTGYYVNPQGTSKVAILLVEDQIRTGNGQQLVLNAGESHGQATGQTSEIVYVNAEDGLQVNSSPDNWSSGWSGRNTVTICDASGNSYFPGRVQASEFFTSGKVIHTGDTDTYTEFNAADTWRVVVGGSQKIVVNSNGLTASNGNLYSSIFYDSDNTSFYLNPSSTTSIYDLIVGSGLQIAQRDWTGNIGTGQNYIASSTSTSNRGNYGGGVWSYSGYSTGTNRPHTYDATLQVMAGDNMGFELSADWLATNKTPLKIRSLRDCCQGWSTWREVMTAEHTNTGNFLTSGSMRADRFYDVNDTAYYIEPNGTSKVNAVVFYGDLYHDTNNRDNGMYGSYDSTKTDHIWSMGTAYRNSSTGTNFGNLYGLAYKHTNNSTGGTMGGGHQMVWCNNGTPRGSIGYDRVWHAGDMQAGGNMYANVFYDDDNTGYYIDAASTSRINKLEIANTGDQDTPEARMKIGSDGFIFGGNNSGYETNSAQISAGYHTANSLNIVGMGTTSSVRRVDMWAEGGFYVSGTIYDKDDPTYYIDPAGTLRQNHMAVNTGSVARLGIDNTSDSTRYGFSLYGGYNSGEPTYGMLFTGTSLGTHGSVTGSWATYFTMNNDNSRGWIFRRVGSGNCASISAGGAATFDSSVRTPIFYDSNNTGYYVNPAATSNLNAATFAGAVTASSFSGDGSQLTGISSSSFSSNSISINGTAITIEGPSASYTGGQITFRDDEASGYGVVGYIKSSNDNNSGKTGIVVNSDERTVLSIGGSTVVSATSAGVTITGTLYGDGSGVTNVPVNFNDLQNKASGTGDYKTTGNFYAGRFYDSNGTNYSDPGGTSQMSVIHLGAPSYSGVYGMEIDVPSVAGGINFTGVSGAYACRFQYGTTTVGSIRINTTSTTYSTTSDYRVKENFESMSGAIDRIKLLNPGTFNFIGYTNIVDGFIAHEVQEIIPEAVVGEKDAIDAEGNPEYQGIDQSKIVPLLTGALQEAIAKIESLEQRLADAGL